MFVHVISALPSVPSKHAKQSGLEGLQNADNTMAIAVCLHSSGIRRNQVAIAADTGSLHASSHRLTLRYAIKYDIKNRAREPDGGRSDSGYNLGCFPRTASHDRVINHEDRPSFHGQALLPKSCHEFWKTRVFPCALQLSE